MNCAKSYLLFPLLSVLSLFIYPVCVYWYPSLRKKAFYSECEGISEASHLYVEGEDGNCEVVKIEHSLEDGQ